MPILPPFLQAQEDCRNGIPFQNPYPAPAHPELDHPHDLYRQGWMVQEWRAAWDKKLKEKS